MERRSWKREKGKKKKKEATHLANSLLLKQGGQFHSHSTEHGVNSEIKHCHPCSSQGCRAVEFIKIPSIACKLPTEDFSWTLLQRLSALPSPQILHGRLS